MSKRTLEEIVGAQLNSLKGGERPQPTENSNDVGDFEDEYEDEFESEDEMFEAGVDGRPDDEREVEERRDGMDVDQQTFIPGRSQLAAGESLSPDTSTYDMLHTLSTTWPCLSFDIVKDNLGDNRKTYPATVYAVAGTQAESRKSKGNELIVMKLSGLSRMDRDRGEEDSDDDSDDDENAEPILETRSLPLTSTTNRIRVHQLPPSGSSRPSTTLTATLTEASEVLIHDVTPHLSAFDVPGTIITPQQNKPLTTLRMHKSEGYAVHWSPLLPQGKLITGDNDGNIYITTGAEGNRWATDSRPYTGHKSSVEDLQWSPNERNVFASASSDGTVKVWDVRSKAHKPAVSVTVSNTDVNVMSWSQQTTHLLATGADDGQWAVWDLRQWKPASSNTSSPAPKPVASFNFHKEQITSIEWHPTDDSIVAVAAGDNTLTLWDLAVELDDEESKDTGGVQDVPPQLLFVHYMEMVKECHWHPQIPGCVMATGGGGFGIFKTISV
ncbi:MAG: glutamate-rich WD repeat-containing 1 [Lasallia pustulata]|uniref:Glutamate-rich WD repeat-containing protein 1 n=1 Tax=Lasallia pustulata TaxID=136370 RepID=A0A5M8PIC8_9LECA|nr:MAG: glutamate-rich WD repeat-containing 1 [Lasallia pustulata]